MLKNALRGGKGYWALLGFWVLVILVGLAAYSQQLTKGLTVTGMSRDVTWGLYIAQFTFLVGVAASAVMVVLPYYLHNYKAFGRMVILGEFLAVSAVLMCALFIFVDLGKPMRVMNVLLYPSLNSVMFWDMMVLMGYLLLNLVIGLVTLNAERKGVLPPAWCKPLIYLSIPWAVSIHTVTAFLFSGLSARPFWMTAILAPRFLASAFASGPCFLIILALILRRYTKFDPGKEAIQKLATIVTYAMVIHFVYLFVGLEGQSALAPWMWVSVLLTLGCVVLLLFPDVRRHEKYLVGLCFTVIVAIWIEKGLGMVVTGFIPSPLGEVTEYMPTGLEVLITLGVYAIGFLVLTVLYKLVVSIREQLDKQKVERNLKGCIG
ncbi:MAG: sulfate reduction electron transfer complex DsrMKJOP subunit DsrP [Planctomycetota bacterium]|jgi:molybdopterin-containing oxidoreductase family membrane subunit